MTRDELHDALDELLPGEKRVLVRVVGHALIALGLLTKLECGYEDCILPTREFTIAVLRNKASPSVDHVKELWEGGTDRPENLRLIHFACNSSKSMKLRMMGTAYRVHMSTIMVGQWQDPDLRAKRSAAKTTTVREQIAASVKAIPRTPCPRCGRMLQPAGHGLHRKSCVKE